MTATQKTPKLVWGWNYGGGKRAIMAADSIAEIVRESGDSRSRITTYGSETGNDVEVTTAMANPHKVLLRSDSSFRNEEPFFVAGTGEKVMPDPDAVARVKAFWAAELAEDAAIEARKPKDTTGAALVPGTVYRFVLKVHSPRPFFAVYRDAVVEDDDSITLVVENAFGERLGIVTARYAVEPITTPSYADEPTLQRAADGDR